MNALKITAKDQGPEEIGFTNDQPLWEQIGTQVGGYFEVVRNTLQKVGMPKGIVMVINEDGLNMGLEYNHIGSMLYPGRIVGDILLMKEGYTDEGPDFVEMEEDDFIECAICVINLIHKEFVGTVRSRIYEVFNTHDCEHCDVYNECDEPEKKERKDVHN